MSVVTRTVIQCDTCEKTISEESRTPFLPETAYLLTRGNGVQELHFCSAECLQSYAATVVTEMRRRVATDGATGHAVAVPDDPPIRMPAMAEYEPYPGSVEARILAVVRTRWEREHEGLTFRQVCAQLGLSEGSARNAVAAAKERGVLRTEPSRDGGVLVILPVLASANGATP
jgi:hypothetical protein